MCSSGIADARGMNEEGPRMTGALLWLAAGWSYFTRSM